MSPDRINRVAQDYGDAWEPPPIAEKKITTREFLKLLSLGGAGVLAGTIGVEKAAAFLGQLGRDQNALAAENTQNPVPTGAEENKAKIVFVKKVPPTPTSGIEFVRKPIVFVELESATTREGTEPANEPAYSGSFKERVVQERSWILPVMARRCGAAFGANNLPFQKNHTGVDICCPSGSELMAVDDGEVIWTAWWPVGWEPKGHGRTLWLYHGKGVDGRPVYSVYAHLWLFNVNLGQIVKKGDVVASSGNTGAGSGPHLHFAVAKAFSRNSLAFSNWDNPDKFFA